MFSKATIIAAVGFLAAQALAGTCQMANVLPQTRSSNIPNRKTICVPQGAGQWTFAMTTDLSTLGIPGLPGEAGSPNTVSSISYLIMDNTCAVKGIYSQPTCGVPWTIEENFLPDVLTVTSVFEDVGDPFFEFKYGYGDYSINNNHCSCASDGKKAPTAGQDCNCAFPVSGKSSKRDVKLSFKA